MDNNNNNNKKEFHSFIDTPHKKRLIFSFLIYFPIISIMAGAPIPFPSLFEVNAEQIALLNFISLLITLLGSIIGVGFYLEKRNNVKMDVQNQKIDKVDARIEEAVVLTRQDMKDLRGELNHLEERVCHSITSKNADIEKIVQVKVDTAKDLVDTRFRNLEGAIRDLKKSIDFIQQFQFGSGAKSTPPYITGQRESHEHKEKPYEGIYHNPDSSETQKHKDAAAAAMEKDYNEFKQFKHNRDKERLEREKESHKRWSNSSSNSSDDDDGGGGYDDG